MLTMLLRLIFRPNETGRKTTIPLRSKRRGADLTSRFHAVGCEFSLSGYRHIQRKAWD